MSPVFSLMWFRKPPYHTAGLPYRDGGLRGLLESGTDETEWRDVVTRNTKQDKPIDKAGIQPNDPPAGMPDIGAPGLGADEMPGGAFTGGDGALDDEKRKDRPDR
jgi:hypothetical protein